MKVLFSVLLTILVSRFDSLAQDNLTPLKVGDKVPIEIWRGVPKDKQSQLVILDFWATWCKSCLEGFPKIDDLQKKFGNRIQFVLVNTDQDDKFVRHWLDGIAKRGSKRKISLPDKVPALNGAQLFKQIFPYTSLPHHVWLDADGEVLAITDGNKATAENIQTALTQGEVQLRYKYDFFADKPLYFGEPLEVNLFDFDHWSIFKKGEVADQPSVNMSRGDRGYALRNVSIFEMLITSVRRLNREVIDNHQIVLDVNDTSRLKQVIPYSDRSRKSERLSWQKNNLYTLDILLPKSEIENDSLAVFKEILSMVNRYSAFTVKIETRSVKTFSLIRTSHLDKISSKGGNGEDKWTTSSAIISNAPLSTLIERIRRSKFMSYPLFDETGYQKNIDISFGKLPNSLTELREALQQYDLDIIEKERAIETLVIKEKSSD